jgi:Rab-GTPase-TBC domain
LHQCAQQLCGLTSALALARGSQIDCWRSSRVAALVCRTDRDHPAFAAADAPLLAAMQAVLLTHAAYNAELGYSQGMSDVLAPLLLALPDEASAFWAFVALLERVGGNFDAGQASCVRQLAALRRLVALLDPPLHAAIDAAGCADMLFCFRWARTPHWLTIALLIS